LEKGAEEWFACDLARTYWRIAPLHGVRPEVTFAQAALETGFGKFGRAVTREHNNFCGLKVANPGPDDSPDSHARFPTPEVGVIAHIEHIALYAGAPGYPKPKPIDTRHFPYLFGTAKDVETLSGHWAPSSTYHVKIIQFINEIKANDGVV
jgi:flagellum-specific peptidoglycan hydrolase FlgJ